MSHRGNPRNHDHGHVHVPPVADPCWYAWTAPLREYLREPRSWAEVLRWEERHPSPVSLLQLLAYLSFTGVIEWDGGRWVPAAPQVGWHWAALAVLGASGLLLSLWGMS